MPIQQRVDKQQALAGLVLRKTMEWENDVGLLLRSPDGLQGSDIQPGEFGLLLSDGQPDHILDMTRWPDLTVRLRPQKPGYNPRDVLVVMSKKQFESDTFSALRRQLGTRGWVLDKGFVDFNTDRMVSFLTHVAGGA